VAAGRSVPGISVMKSEHYNTRWTSPPYRYPDESLATRMPSLRSAASARGSLVGPDWREYVFEADLEAKAMKFYFAQSDFVSLIEQPEFVGYVNANGMEKRHTFDLLVTMKSTERFFVQVKPELFVSESFIAEMSLIASQNGHRADWVEIFTDRNPHPNEIYNAELVMSVRRDPPSTLDGRILELLADTFGAVRISWIVGTFADGAAFRAVVRLIDAGFLELVAPGRITPQSLVKNSPEWSDER
jgi:hypothetical protein